MKFQVGDLIVYKSVSDNQIKMGSQFGLITRIERAVWGTGSMNIYHTKWSDGQESKMGEKELLRLTDILLGDYEYFPVKTDL